jgi:hypothetical protein
LEELEFDTEQALNDRDLVKQADRKIAEKLKKNQELV